MYDLIIVGAGPSGSMLAYQCARLGYRVLILEKACFPRIKPCGGGLTFKALKNLPFDIHPVVEVEAVGGIVAFQGRHLFKTNQVRLPFAWLVNRPSFDQYLVQKAVDSGAEFIDGEEVTSIGQDEDQVTVYTSNHRFQSTLLVGADGVHSLVAKKSGLIPNRKIGFAVEIEINVSQTVIQSLGPYACFDFGALKGGYGWIFPKKDHLSVGVFCSRGENHHLRKKLETFISFQTILEGGVITKPRAHPIPLGGYPYVYHQNRILLVGDAANLADPWLGEGIYAALASAYTAADVIQSSLAQKEPNLAPYTHRINQELVNQLYYAQKFANLVYRFPYMGCVLLAKSQRMQELVFGAMRGDITFRELYQDLLSSLPVIVFQSLVNRKESNI